MFTYNLDNAIEEWGTVMLGDLKKLIYSYEDEDYQNGLELAIGLVIVAMGGEFESDSRQVKRDMTDREITAEKNNEKKRTKKENKTSAQETNLHIPEIAELHNMGLTQAQISKVLGISERKVKYSVDVMSKNEEYSDYYKLYKSKEKSGIEKTVPEEVEEPQSIPFAPKKQDILAPAAEQSDYPMIDRFGGYQEIVNKMTEFRTPENYCNYLALSAVEQAKLSEEMSRYQKEHRKYAPMAL